jgi:ethanolamine utilization microcompartment shell protein EutS
LDDVVDDVEPGVLMLDCVLPGVGVVVSLPEASIDVVVPALVVSVDALDEVPGAVLLEGDDVSVEADVVEGVVLGVAEVVDPGTALVPELL